MRDWMQMFAGEEPKRLFPLPKMPLHTRGSKREGDRSFLPCSFQENAYDVQTFPDCAWLSLTDFSRAARQLVADISSSGSAR